MEIESIEIHSPSQNMQSHAHRKHVVASGLLHRLHDRAGADGRADVIEWPEEVPGGIPGPARVEDMVRVCCP